MAGNGGAACGDGFWHFAQSEFNSVRTISLSDKLTQLLRREKARKENMRTYHGEHYATYCANNPLYIEGGSAANPAPVNPVHSGGGSNTVNFVCVRDNGTYVTSRTM